jgi:predicted protein tyrosine phosphatase
MNLKILSLSEAQTTREKFTHVISLLETNYLGDIPHLGIPPERRLLLICDDVSSPEVEEFSTIRPPTKEHVSQGLAFARSLPSEAKLLVHCYAGVSRSTAMAYAILCQTFPKRSEIDLLRRLAPTRKLFIPNGLILIYADELLQRYGRMVEAVEEYRLNPRRFRAFEEE